MYLFVDTETTDKKPGRAKLVQLAALLTDATGREVMSQNVIIKRDDIPAETTAIHGITNEFAMTYGVDQGHALDLLQGLVNACQFVVGHNVSYDVRVIENAFRGLDGDAADPFAGKKAYCTKENATHHCRLPRPTGGGSGYKWPTLTEAYEHFFGSTFEGAHTAMDDVFACRDVFFALVNAQKAERAAAQAAA